MAALKKRRAKWYARVRWYDKYGKRVEKQIPLHTTRETVAIERLIQIEKKEKYITHVNINRHLEKSVKSHQNPEKSVKFNQNLEQCT